RRHAVAPELVPGRVDLEAAELEDHGPIDGPPAAGVSSAILQNSSSSPPSLGAVRASSWALATATHE
ncbi:MAG TPA: hypothetical protein VL856_02855, partial [Acidimicrobiia bacterium]|nr:hypothetical protein [Acidimicrobiia bacterium]